MPQAPSRLKDIALRMGLSTATVSRALRDDPQISADTIARVKKAAEEMGYNPDPYVAHLMARLREGRPARDRIPAGLLIDDRNVALHQTSYFRRCMEGMQARAEARGYSLVRFPLERDLDRSIRSALRAIRARGMRGVILAPLSHLAEDLSSIDWSGVATVAVGYAVRRPQMPRVTAHSYRSMLTALQHLENRGRRRIGYCMLGDTDSVNDSGWLAGYMVYQHRHPGGDPIPPFMQSPHFTEAAFREWFRKYRPDALVFCHSILIDWLLSWGVGIPDDVAVADLNRTNDRFAGIDQRIETLGATAVDVMADLIHRNELGRVSDGTELLIPGLWMDGPSV